MLRERRFRNRAEWLGARGIGATDVAAIMGFSKWKTPADVYSRIALGKKEPEKKGEALTRGQRFEPLIRREFALDYKDVYRVTAPPKGNWIFWDDERPYLTGTPDGLLTRKSDGERGGLEIKTADLFGPASEAEWDSKVPMAYYVQVLTYMAILKAKFWFLRARLRFYRHGEDGKAVLDHVEVRDYLFGEETKADQEKVLKAVDAFWNENVGKRRMPAMKFKA